MGLGPAGIQKAHTCVAAQFADGLQAHRFDAIEPFFLGKLAIDGQVGLVRVQIRHDRVQVIQIRIDHRLVCGLARGRRLLHR